MQKLRQAEIKKINFSEIFLFLLIVLSILLLSIYMANKRGLWSSLETQSAQIAREFFKTKQFIIPYLNGAQDYEKPAFFFWLIALSSIIFGKINELTARLPSIISILIVISSMYLLTKNEIKKFIAAAVIFVSSPKIFWMSQVARIDMFFSSLCFASSALLYAYIDNREKKYLTLSAIFSALAFLTKGPLGLIIPLFPAIIFLIMGKNKKILKDIFSAKNILIFSIIALPWYIAVTIKTNFGFFKKFFLSDNIGRFIGPSNISIAREFSKRQPFWFYIPHFISDFFPWSIAMFFYLIEKIKENKFSRIDLYFFIYLSFIFLFFSIL